MNKDTFLHLLQQPSPVSLSQAAALEEIVKEYPYFQLAYSLIAKAHQQGQSTQVNEKVKKAAVYAVNRNVLKKSVFTRVGPADSKLSLPLETATQGTSTAETKLAENTSEPVLSIDPPELSYFGQETTPPAVEANQEKEMGGKASISQEESPENAIQKTDKTVQSEIIDNFIKKEPRISSLQRANKDTPQNSQDLSEKSIILPSGIISENLAGIMIKQGKTDKAIDIYEKLILKYPQKKAYFASKIEELKKT